MDIRQVIAELEGSAEIRERLAARIDGLVGWLKQVPREQLGTSEIPDQHKVAIREINLSSEWAEAAIRSAEAFAPGCVTAWEKLRANLESAGTGAPHWERFEAVAINIRATFLLLRRTAAVLRSLAGQNAEPGAAADGGA